MVQLVFLDPIIGMSATTKSPFNRKRTILTSRGTNEVYLISTFEFIRFLTIVNIDVVFVHLGID